MIAVVPAAGLGTRMARVTGGMAKELLEVGRRPVLVWVLDEAYIGGEAEFGQHGRSTEKKAAVVCAVERVGMMTGRCKLAVFEDCTKKTLHGLAQGTPKLDATVHMDG